MQAMRPFRPPAASVGSSGSADSTATPFVETVGAPSADPGSGPGAVPPDSLRSEGVVPRPPDGAAAGAAGAAATQTGGDGAFTVQLGSFQDADRAAIEARRLQGLGLPVRVEIEEVGGAAWHRLRFGRYRTREEAEESALARCTGLGWRVVRAVP